MTSATTLTRRGLLASAGLGFTSLLRAADPKPNVVVILADDQGWGDLSVHGNTNLSTPHIDGLARDGAIFDRFFVCAVCAPTRAEYLTGRYHARGGVRGVSTGQERLNLEERTIAQTFKAAGYATGAFGKWHNGSQHPYHPNARGFDEFYGFTSGHWGQYFDTEMDHNGQLVRGQGYIIDDEADHAMSFIEQNRTRPFYCYIPFNSPHSPMQVPDRFYRKFAKKDLTMLDYGKDREDIEFTRAALAMCENVDWNVGRVLAKLDELKLRDDTIVIYFSDNGPNSWRWNGGMKGRKASVDEGGLRVPFLIRWPGHIRPGTKVARIAGAIDIMPTLCELTGVTVDVKKPLDGRSLKPLLLGERVDWADRMIFSLQGKRISVRTQRHRLDADGALFDMIADPGQKRDISAEQPVVAAQLRKAVADWGKEMLPLVGRDDRPYTVGFSKMTYLPARDGVAEGGIRRSAQAPNSSFFTNWKTMEDAITWDIEVGEPGTFTAEVHYTCAAADTGSTVELSFLDSRISAKISMANDPPLVGKEFDRFPRAGESYVKAFKPLRLGNIKLAKGRGKLRLKALEIKGSQVADVRYVILTRNS